MKNLILLFFLFLFFSCDHHNHIDCDKEAIVDNELYLNGPDDHITINGVEVEDDCLNINFGASGCDGSTWKIELYDSGNIAESWPEQRYIRLSLKNQELCDAYFERELSFDISGLKVSGNEVILNLTNWADQISYIY